VTIKNITTNCKLDILNDKNFNPKNIIRITADCPLVDAKMIDKLISIFKKKRCDYLSNTYPPSFPDGLDIEIFKAKALKDAWKSTKKNMITNMSQLILNLQKNFV
jgi:spore coat polysaccharide biosynthesis protein SpsF (cytidylyltransferase family)